MYDQIARNKRDSVLLVAIIIAVLLTLGFAIGFAYWRSSTAGIGLLGVFGIVAIVWSLIGYYGGAGIVLAASHAQRVTRDQAPVLWDVVEEMSIAGGIPMPAVYVINDPAPNAFATGRDPKHASVAVTAGLLQMMSRDELQGVIAHEMSHVRNFDIRFATLVGVLVGMIALIADFFLRSTLFGFGGRRSSNNNNGGARGGHLSDRHRARHPGAVLRPHGADGDLAPPRVPGRRLGRRAHPQPARPGSRPAEDRRRPALAAGRDQGDRAPLHRQPPQGQEDKRIGGPLRHPPAHPEAHRHPARHGARRPRRPADAAGRGRLAAHDAGSAELALASPLDRASCSCRRLPVAAPCERRAVACPPCPAMRYGDHPARRF